MGDTPYAGTMLEFLHRNAQENASSPATIDGDRTLTWQQYHRRAQAIALALLDLGVAPGDAVGLHMSNRTEHVLADMGALLAGATPTTYYNTLAADQLAYVAGDSAATVVVADAAQLPRWQSIRDQLPKLRHVLVVGLDPATDLAPGVLRFDEVVDAAEAQLTERVTEVEATAARVRPQDALTIVYTSGTTGHPKGTIITHDGVLWVMEKVLGQLREHRGVTDTVGWAMVSYLPLAHIAERMFSHYLGVRQAFTVTFVDDPTKVAEVLPTCRPHLFFGVPRMWEKVHGTLRERAAGESSPVRRLLLRSGIAVAVAIGTGIWGGKSPSVLDRLAHPVLDRLLYRRIRAGIGLDRVEMALTGAAPIAPEVLAFFSGLGVPIIEGYGMTESSAAISFTPLNAPRLGSVGKALDGVELRIAEDGEILARGPNITPGYLNRPEATAEAIDADGWLHTGDLGTVDGDGYLFVTGRKKELIITAGGKNLSPNNIELAISGRSDLIGTVYAFGDRKPYLVALVTLDPLGWKDWCAARGIEVDSVAEAVADRRVRDEVARAVREGNETLARVEQIKNWTLLDRLWDTQSGELTPTMKLKRPVVLERYQGEIDKLYSST